MEGDEENVHYEMTFARLRSSNASSAVNVCSSLEERRGAMLFDEEAALLTIDVEENSRDSGVAMEIDDHSHFDFSTSLLHSSHSLSRRQSENWCASMEEHMDEYIFEEVDGEPRGVHENASHRRVCYSNEQFALTDVTNAYSDSSKESFFDRRKTVNVATVISRGEDSFEEWTNNEAMCSKRSQRRSKSSSRRFCEIREEVYSLETVSRPQIDSSAFRSISAETLFGLLTLSEDFHSRFLLVDCRYPYEYNGGHIKGAINVHDPALVGVVFYPLDSAKFVEVSRKIPIFYCEYSQKRGPLIAHSLRAFDRRRNEARYPEVDYKEIYLLDRGYKRFFEHDSRHTRLCEPSDYVPMVEPSYKDELKRFRMHKTRSLPAFESRTRRCAPVQKADHVVHSVVDHQNSCPSQCTPRVSASVFTSSPTTSKQDSAETPLIMFRRRGRLAFRSVSQDASPPSRGRPSPFCSRAQPNGSPFGGLSSAPSTPPRSSNSPIPMANFS